MPEPLLGDREDSALHPDDAAAVLARCYAERAGEEALFRALLAERDLKRDKARFWVGVYERLSAEAG